MSVRSPEPISTAGTIVCPHLDVPHQPGMNLVWSASLELAWKRLMKQAGGPIELAGVAPDDPAARLVKILNESPVDEGMLPPDATAAWAGRADERGARELRRESERVFGPAARPVDVPEDGRIAVVGGLNLHPRFAVPFARGSRSIVCDDDKFARSFGFWFDDDEPRELWERRAKQVVVHFPRYSDDELGDLSDEEEEAAWNDFVIELRLGQNADVSVVVASAGRRSTLRGTVEHALSFLRNDDHAPNARFTQKEGICMPVVDLHCEARFDELVGLPVTNAGLRSEQLGSLRERIHFRFDEGGPSTVSTLRNPYGGALTTSRRLYTCKSHFLVLTIVRPVREPIFAAWFANFNAFVEGPEPEDWRRLRAVRRVNARGGRGPAAHWDRAMSPRAARSARQLS